MEYCGGGSIAEVCKILDMGLEEDAIALICREALKGLKYLHKIHKIHRDIKGGNILLTENGQVKLADFGVSAKLCDTFSKRNTFVGTVRKLLAPILTFSIITSMIWTYFEHENCQLGRDGG